MIGGKHFLNQKLDGQIRICIHKDFESISLKNLKIKKALGEDKVKSRQNQGKIKTRSMKNQGINKAKCKEKHKAQGKWQVARQKHGKKHGKIWTKDNSLKRKFQT